MSRATGIFTITSWKPTTTLQLQISIQGLLTSHVNQVLQSAVHLYWYRTGLVTPPPQDMPMKFYYTSIPPTEIESTPHVCFERTPACYNLVYLWDSTRLGLGRIFLPDVISFLSSGFYSSIRFSCLAQLAAIHHCSMPPQVGSWSWWVMLYMWAPLCSCSLIGFLSTCGSFLPCPAVTGATCKDRGGAKRGRMAWRPEIRYFLWTEAKALVLNKASKRRQKDWQYDWNKFG